ALISVGRRLNPVVTNRKRESMSGYCCAISAEVSGSLATVAWRVEGLALLVAGQAVRLRARLPRDASPHFLVHRTGADPGRVSWIYTRFHNHVQK
ncbi:MAG: hypothetical protein LAQ30_27175, partial [Acidobacteriia bacterium]|nr:hypothetical protein [Terriglobia bacterium]